MLGKASEIKTKVIYEFDKQISSEINNFFSTIPNANVIDIKFNTYVKNDDEGDDVQSVYNIALIIYKEESA